MFNQILNNITKKNIEKEVIYEMREQKNPKIALLKKHLLFYT